MKQSKFLLDLGLVNLQIFLLHIIKFIVRFNPQCFVITGAAYTAKSVSFSEEEKIQLNVWDTSGAERFDSLTKLYYRDAQVGCLVVIGFSFTFV